MTRSAFSLKVLMVAAALSLPAWAWAADPAMGHEGMKADSAMSHEKMMAGPGMSHKGVLVDHHGMTLYTFDKDSAGKSACNGDPCETNWPPLSASATDKGDDKWSVIKRDDGKLQWAYAGKPLYTFKDDKKGDKNGDGKGGVWRVAKP
ncbi:hypothetical protein HX776_07615 [Pseudomonas agarici]|uniref:COG4315 family predicted lipoprotein n=1 Tax=Pseudomonas agarici TaxID=46677 RepID=UPI000309056E|nr:hypothetical protein [Pseudomonas agarici]NWC08685.1 hypothetical protein [Pseudomonas agarici]SEK54849.1 Predicted lipoprotein with conserved Yx(FWY)xxD motif [Pseudomonas agarici]